MAKTKKHRRHRPRRITRRADVLPSEPPPPPTPEPPREKEVIVVTKEASIAAPLIAGAAIGAALYALFGGGPK